MKRLSLVAAGLAIALSVGAQTIQTTPEEKQEPVQQEGKAKVEENTKLDQGRAVNQGVQPTERESARVNDQAKVHPNERRGARGPEQSAKVLHSTTVFRYPYYDTHKPVPPWSEPTPP
jgi:Mg2+ and Co2+ transporter CorA